MKWRANVKDLDGNRYSRPTENGNRLLKVGLIGFGYWGSNYFRVLTQLENIRLKYVCDKDITRLRNLTNVSFEICNDVRTLAEDRELDAVIIATPASSHFEIAKMMIESGKNVLVEKPMTINYRESLRLCELSEELDRILMVGHIYIYNSAVNYIKSYAPKVLGDLFYGAGLRMGLGPIRNDASCTWDLAAHDVAMLDYLLNETPYKISATGKCFLQTRSEVYDYAAIDFEYKSGFRFSLIVSWYAPEKIRTWYLVGSNGMVKFDDTNKNAPLTIYRRHAVQQGYSTGVSEGDTVIPFVSQEEPLLLQVKHFIEAVRTGKKPLTDGRQGARVVKVLEAIEESIRKGGSSVRIDHHE